ncbi:hypothetical protein C8Q79DRAFT_928435 [Trametes meyenii]|nr:hypothetical protein C8Q79DRAFT_928435 [Trametes meyenii]
MEAESSTPAPRPVRRSARTPAKTPTKQPTAVARPPPESPSGNPKGKRKAREPAEKSSAEKLEHLLTNSKSKLTKLDITGVINYANFLDLSEEAQRRLCALLPPTAFTTFAPSVSPTHPDYVPAATQTGHSPDDDDRMQVDVDGQPPEVSGGQTPATLDPSVLTSPFFLSAAHTFQDHLFSSWLAKKASDDLAKFREGAMSGDLHVDWKDEVWERDQQRPAGTTRSKPAPKMDMNALAKHGLLQKGDVLAYKRAFPALNVTVEKDVLIESVDPQTHALSFLLPPGTQRSLPPALLSLDPHECEDKILSVAGVSDPVALERAVLDSDGRIRSADKYEHDVAACTTASPLSPGFQDEVANVIAVRGWKSFTVWRWREEHRAGGGDGMLPIMEQQERAGREKVATLFYLRGCCLSAS